MSSRPYRGAGGRALRAALLGAALLSLAAAGCEKKGAGFTSSGTFEAVEVDAGSQVVGQLMVLSKREGDAVAKGELLARVDTRKLEIQRDLLQVQLEQVALDEDLIRKSIEAAKISLENDLKSLERTRVLFNQRSATQQQLDDMTTAVELDRNRLATAQKNRQGPPIRRRELEANLRLVEQNIQDSQVNSPIDGQVTVRYVEPGEIVTVGQSLLRLADLSLLQIRVYLPAARLGAVKLGQPVRLRAEGAQGRDFSGKVVWISPVAEFTPKNVQTPEARAELVYAIKLEVPNPDGALKIGMPADAYFE